MPSGFFNEMSGHELDRFLDFVSRFLEETRDSLGLETPAREVPIMVQLMRSHLRGRMETPSSLIEGSGLPRGTAHRLIEDMVGRGLIAKRPRTRSGKTYSLHPSRKLIEDWLNYVRRMKSLLGTAFGLDEGTDYFFGASYLSAAGIPPLPVMSQKLSLPGGLRILLHADPAFMAMQRLKQQFELHFGIEIDVRALSIDRLHDEILENAGRAQSRYDLVTCDVCWMEEMIRAGAVQEIERLEGPDSREFMDFHPEALSTNQRGNALFGIPVQTVPELFIYRIDLLSEAGVAPPVTLEEMRTAARRLNDPVRGIHGICWNGARGTPVGTTFMMLMADFGQPVLNLPRTGTGFVDRDLAPENLVPMLLGPEATAAAELLIELLEYSPPNVLQMSWYERARCFADGHAAMSYCYTQLLPVIESDPGAVAHGRTGYLPHPAAAGVPQIAPLGGWNICVPGNLKPARLDAVRQAARTLTSAAATKLYIENGSLVSSRFSVCNDPSVAHGRPIIATVDRMARSGQLQSWPRPAVPQLNTLVHVIGEEIHMMLLRNKKPHAALRDAQARCEKVMGVRG
jgi:multiple sugar transport system substrate-binding protein